MRCFILISLKRNSKGVLAKATGLRTRSSSIYKPNQEETFKVSRSKFNYFLSCQRCFYLDRVAGIVSQEHPVGLSMKPRTSSSRKNLTLADPQEYLIDLLMNMVWVMLYPSIIQKWTTGGILCTKVFHSRSLEQILFSTEGLMIFGLTKTRVNW